MAEMTVAEQRDKTIQLADWEIKELTAEKAVEWLKSVSLVSGSRALMGLASIIERQAAEIKRLNAVCDAYSKNGYLLADEADKEVARMQAEIERLKKENGDLLDVYGKIAFIVHAESKSPADVCKIIEKLMAVYAGAKEMVRCQNSGYVDFHENYGKALRQTEKALKHLQEGR